MMAAPRPRSGIAVAAAVLGGLLLGACAADAPFDAGLPDLAAADAATLCTIVGLDAYRADDATKELEKRGVFSADDWRHINGHQLYQGMSECGVLAAFGPIATRYVFKEGNSGKIVQQQFVYACAAAKVPECPFTNVVMVDGKVVSWSAAETADLLPPRN